MYKEVAAAFKTIYHAAHISRQKNEAESTSDTTSTADAESRIRMARQRGIQVLRLVQEVEARQQEAPLGEKLQRLEKLQETLMQPDVEEGLDQASKRVHPGTLLIPTGSTAYGGWIIRELAGTTGNSDVDLYIKYPTSDKSIKQGWQTREIVISELNPRGFRTEVHGGEPITDDIEVTLEGGARLLEQLRSPEVLEGSLIASLTRYFSRGFPEQAMHEGRIDILTVLHELSHVDHAQWEKVITAMVEAFTTILGTQLVKEKYFTKSTKLSAEETTVMFQQLADFSNVLASGSQQEARLIDVSAVTIQLLEVRGAVFRDLLESTSQEFTQSTVTPVKTPNAA